MSERLRFGDVTVDIDDEQQTVTTQHPDAPPVVACNRADQAQTAADLGYDSVWALNRAHDPLHTRLCHALGLRRSPTLWAVAHGETPPQPLTDAEEAMVLAAQRFLQRAGPTAAAGDPPRAHGSECWREHVDCAAHRATVLGAIVQIQHLALQRIAAASTDPTSRQIAAVAIEEPTYAWSTP